MSRTNLAWGTRGVALVVGIACVLAAAAAQASLTVNLRFADQSTLKVLTPLSVGTTIEMRVYATITNELNPLGLPDPPGGDNINGSGISEGLQFLSFNIFSEVVHAGINGALAYRGTSGEPTQRHRQSLVSPFNGTGSQGGPPVITLPDLNGDGVQDIGSLANERDSNVIRPRSSGITFDFDGDGVPGQSLSNMRVLPNGVEFLVARYNFTPTQVGPGVLRFNVQIPSWILESFEGALWWQDSLGYEIDARDGVNRGFYFAGSSVQFGIPEPSAPALAGLGFGGLLLVARRRRG